MTTDTTERGLETLIVAAMTGSGSASAAGGVGAPAARYGGRGWLPGDWHDYDREFCVDLAQHTIFLQVAERKRDTRQSRPAHGPQRDAGGETEPG